MSDTRLKSLSEVALNILVGFVINFAINITIFPYFGIPFDIWVYLQIGGIYTITSICIQYITRRIFNRIKTKQGKLDSLTETAVNVGVGWIMCYATGLIILPLYGMKSTLDITIVNTIGTIITTIRRYIFRRIFNHFGEKENLYSLTLRLYNRIKNRNHV